MRGFHSIICMPFLPLLSVSDISPLRLIFPILHSNEHWSPASRANQMNEVMSLMALYYAIRYSTKETI